MRQSGDQRRAISLPTATRTCGASAPAVPPTILACKCTPPRCRVRLKLRRTTETPLLPEARPKLRMKFQTETPAETPNCETPNSAAETETPSLLRMHKCANASGLWGNLCRASVCAHTCPHRCGSIGLRRVWAAGQPGLVSFAHSRPCVCLRSRRQPIRVRLRARAAQVQDSEEGCSQKPQMTERALGRAPHAAPARSDQAST
jgi:hypothetical protein